MTNEIKLTNLVREIGVPAHVVGYKYLQDAISMVMADPTMVSKITKELYPIIADKNNSTPSRVERAMRHAISLSWVAGSPDLITSIFKVVPEKPPCVSQFVCTLADTLAKDMY